MELFLPEQIALNETTNALLGDVEETARRVNEYRPLPLDVVKRIEDGLVGERVYTSNAIEGNTLDLRETVTVLKTGRILENKRREAIEARNLGEAVQRISQIVKDGHSVHTVEQLFETHKLILRDTPDEYWGGRFREQAVVIEGAKHQPPDYTIVPTVVDRVMERLRNDDDEIPPLLKASWAHWALARIHPFKDGNGRISRLWQDLVLFQHSLTCAIITPEMRREYLDALTSADDGDFNPLVQLVSQRILATFDRHLSEIAKAPELNAFAKEIAGEADARIDEKRQLAYQRWVRTMDQLRWEFEVVAAKINEQSGRVRIKARKHSMIDKPKWDLVRSGIATELPTIFTLIFDCDERRRRYDFFVGKHYQMDHDDVLDRVENPVGLCIFEDYGTSHGKVLDEIEDCPISIRELLLVQDEFVVRKRDPRTGVDSYDRAIEPSRIAQDFIRDVVLHRMT